MTEAKPAAEPSITAREALSESTFWWLSGGFFLVNFAATVLTVHLIPYLIDHGSVTFLMGPDGSFVSLFPHTTTAETMAQGLKTYVR